MKKFLFFISLIIGTCSCKSQETTPLNELFVNKYISDFKDELNLFNNEIYIYGEGKDFYSNSILVNFLDLEEIKELVSIKGKFRLIEMSEINVSNEYLKVTFDILIALENEEADFAGSDNTFITYCARFDCNSKKYIITLCKDD